MDPAALAKAIEGGGYGARRDDIRLTLVGALSKEKESYFFTLNDVQPGPQIFTLSGDVNLLEPLLGKSVKIEATWKAARKGDAGASLKLLSAVAEPEKAR